MRRLRGLLVVLAASTVLTVGGGAVARAHDNPGQSSFGTLPSGATACVGPFFADGDADNHGVQLVGDLRGGTGGVKWKLFRNGQPDFNSATKIFQVNASSVLQSYTPAANPELFPAFFWGCVTNGSGPTVDYLVGIQPAFE